MLEFIISSAQAQDAAGTPNSFMSFVPLVAVFFVFYFLMLRPQKKKMEQERKYVEGIKKGDEVFTKSGILGLVHGVNEKIVTLEVEGGVKFKILKSQIGGSSKNILTPEAKS